MKTIENLCIYYKKIDGYGAFTRKKGPYTIISNNTIDSALEYIFADMLAQCIMPESIIGITYENIMKAKKPLNFTEKYKDYVARTL